MGYDVAEISKGEIMPLKGISDDDQKIVVSDDYMCWCPLRLVHQDGHRSEVGLRNYIGRPSSEQLRACSDILSDALSGRPHQSQQPSFTALSSRVVFI